MFDNTPEGPLADAFVAAAAELGIQFKVEKKTWPEILALVNANERTYDILIGVWWSDFPDPAGNLLPNFHTGAWNTASYSNPEVDRLLDEQNALLDPAQRTERLIQAQALIMADIPWVGLWHPTIQMALNQEFTGYTINPLWSWDAFAKDIKQR
jgi:peptide/nickel transport system substrate-binding protein